MSLDYDVRLFTPETETMHRLHPSIDVHHLAQNHPPKFDDIDTWSTIVLFFHDHDWEPPILHHALKSDAYYIGAQGSKRTNETRLQTLADMGSSPKDCARLRSPIGLINSVRDEKTLAVSVLAEILAEVKIQGIA